MERPRLSAACGRITGKPEVNSHLPTTRELIAITRFSLSVARLNLYPYCWELWKLFCRIALQTTTHFHHQLSGPFMVEKRSEDDENDEQSTNCERIRNEPEHGIQGSCVQYASRSGAVWTKSNRRAVKWYTDMIAERSSRSVPILSKHVKHQ